MQATAYDTLKDLVLHHAAGRGWRTQRQIAVMCGLDETNFSRFLNGEQDLGARRTHAIFQAVGIPVAEYDVAYALLGRAQDTARTAREARLRVPYRPPDLPVEAAPPSTAHGRPAAYAPAWVSLPAPAPAARSAGDGGSGVRAAPPLPPLAPHADLPAAVVIGLFAAAGYSGEQIAAFFEE